MRLPLLALVLLLLTNAGCSSKIKPGATFTLSILAKDKAGKLTPEGARVEIVGASVESKQEIEQDGQTSSLVVRKTQYGKATFEVTFPDKTTQMFQVKAGEIKDIFPRGQKFGVRIALHESH
ncbi:MAG TPA: hypothetical protein VE999_00100 [Gemmataceae bacterium]|nr:hypothetical protein [Gemmataceae bacterium]